MECEFDISDSIGVDFAHTSYTNFIRQNQGAEVCGSTIRLGQALPSPVYFSPTEPLVKYEISNTAEFDHAIGLTEERVEGYHLVSGLTRCCYSTQSFDAWWSNYFNSHCPPLKQVLTNLNLTSIV
ncbi:hypothetical protein PIB30_085594 [Stylosanthes scabra]|uniref:Uncharacterized protein n=1 Tax=Stylosanthes scabra TaxID=79078 RepID=A0ABU6WR80_9FABA|nr:hypothetical protein [Stylosanthes scabra]